MEALNTAFDALAAHIDEHRGKSYPPLRKVAAELGMKAIDTSGGDPTSVAYCKKEGKQRLMLQYLFVPSQDEPYHHLLTLKLRGTKPSPWLAAILDRKPPKLVAVALANKFARIAWRLMMSGGVYNRPPALTPS